MSEFRVGDAAVLRGTIELPRVGRWTATLALDADEAPTGAVTVTVAVGSDTVTLSGYAYRSGEYLLQAQVLVVGGAGGLGTQLDARFYDGTTVRDVLNDLARDAGETVSDASTSDVLDVQLPKWTRRVGPASHSLDALARAAGATWRVLTDGKLWLGVETWDDAGLEEYDLLADHPDEGFAEIGAPAYPAALLPGTTFRAQHVGKVRHMIGPRSLRTQVRFEGASSNDETGMLRAVVAQAVAPLRWLGTFAGKVSAVANDDTLSINLDDPTMPGLSKVPLLAFAPGAKSEVKADARVVVVFLGGDPRLPAALPAFEYDAAKQKAVTVENTDGAKVSLASGGALDIAAADGQDLTMNNGEAKVGRVDDQVEVTIPAGSFVTTVTGQAAGVLNSSDVKVHGTVKAGAEHVRA